VRVCRFRSISHTGSFYFAPQIAITVWRADTDVIHAHNYHAFPLLFAAASVTDEQLVVTTHYHGASANGVRNVLLSGYRPLGRYAVRRTNDLISVSNWERERLEEDFGVEATVIPNRVDINRFANAEAERRDRQYLPCVGRLEKYKGVQHVIRALSELPEYDLVIAGSGPYRNELERIAREEYVSDRVDLLGYAEDERIPKLYSGAAVYLALSEFEAYGIIVVEALSAGTPCVVREKGGLRNWTRRDGVIGVSDTSALELSNAVRSVVEQSPSEQIPTWDNVVSELIEVYSEPTECERVTKKPS